MDPTPAAQALFDSASGQVTDNLPYILTGIGGIAVVAFTIKAVWVAWRAAGKAVGKTGS